MTTYTFDKDLFSDLYKDVNGCRPISSCEFYHCTDDRKQEIWDYYRERIEEQIVEEREANQAAISELEDKIAQLIESGAGDRETAVRWLFDNKDNYDSIEYVLWTWGIHDSQYTRKLSTEYSRATLDWVAA